jgi:competence protein ComGC
MKKDAGFTLVDLLLILGILAIILLLLSPNINKYIKENNDKQMLVYTNNLISKIKDYSNKHSDEFVKLPDKSGSLYKDLLYIHKNISEIYDNKNYIGSITIYSDNTFTIDLKDKDNNRCIYIQKSNSFNKEDIKHNCK